jgi:hypothetical protein
VLTVAVIIGAFELRDRLRIDVGEGRGSGGARKPQAASTPPAPVGISGDAPWALSALPECFTQLSLDRGPRKFLLAHLPAHSVAIPPHTTLNFSDCTIFTKNDEVYVHRGRDAFRIPAPARLYQTPGSLSLLRMAEGAGELRVYQPVTINHL